MNADNPNAFVVCLGLDAMRLAMGKRPLSFTPFQIVGLLSRAAEMAQPLAIHPDVAAAHAEFGGDLREMQRLYDKHHPLSTPHHTEQTNG